MNEWIQRHVYIWIVYIKKVSTHTYVHSCDVQVNSNERIDIPNLILNLKLFEEFHYDSKLKLFFGCLVGCLTVCHVRLDAQIILKVPTEFSNSICGSTLVLK